MNQYECLECLDIGFVSIEIGDFNVAVKCSCYEKRATLRRLRKSGISEEFQQKGFKGFDCRGIASLEEAKKKAQAYYQNFLDKEKERYNSILFCGQVGSGKTHLGMAICNNLLNACYVEIAYMAYRNAITEIKQTMMDNENYQNALKPFFNARLLYIDDLLKGKTTEADLNILYELVNYRYMNNKPMVISTEKTPEQLIEFDEGVGSRILEMCRGNIIFFQDKELNYRLYSS